ncbi:spore germination protein GerPC [Peribacillus glennii]|uniref:Spore gernimation protein n=1 Tax=Peribacillus glennii TaxID=2303991 RepID=A0A372LA71_9BACI|nr:spore germination protein GerPC [Peribacillus glennii]RFU62151.1 spore gernimation protein [Peribacillus glennii]
MQHEFYSYTIQMQRYLAAQEKRIAQLENHLQILRDEIEELKKKPPVNVGRIEYKFDQLKVESLEGTLNIGLNPNDLAGLDEFAVNGVSAGMPYLFPERDAMIQQITQTLSSQMDEIIAETEKKTAIPIDPSYREFIKSDVFRQLPQRIEMYLNKTPLAERTTGHHDNMKEKIIQNILNDIHLAIENFTAYSNKQPGGYEENGV